MMIRMENISKRFGSVHANQDVTLEIRPGEVLALLGENGAGKSTLMKILYGLYPADNGTIFIDGNPSRIESPIAAMSIGIGMVFQQFNLIPAFTVRENLLLAHPNTPPILPSRGAEMESYLTSLRLLAPDLNIDSRVSDLAAGQMQLIELAKVLALNAKVILLDEPTSVLTPTEAHALHGRIRTLAEEGRSVVLITHKYEDVLACADRVAVMRQGRLVEDVTAKGLDPNRLANLMVGEGKIQAANRIEKKSAAKPKLEIQGLNAGDAFGSIHNIDLTVHEGEILGIAGVSGNGQNVLAECIAGLRPYTSGEIIFEGSALIPCPQGAVPRKNMAYIPERPALNGVAADMTVQENLLVRGFKSLPFLPKLKTSRESTLKILHENDVRPPDPDKLAGTLSGGNLQKLVIARELDGTPSLVLVCYPTMGLDVAAAQTVYRKIFSLAHQGAAVLWISEELDDLLRFSHRIAVLFHGEIVGESDTENADRNRIGRLMMGAKS